MSAIVDTPRGQIESSITVPRIGDPPPSWTYPAFTYTGYRLTDDDIDRIAERIIEKLEARGIEFVDATRSDEV